jgi:hypothetical protein
MTDMNRRSAISLALAATAVAAVPNPASAQAPAAQGISRQTWGKSIQTTAGHTVSWSCIAPGHATL